MTDDLSVMIGLAKAIVERKPIPPMFVEAQIMGLARTVMFFADRTAVMPEPKEMRQQEPA